MSNASAPAAPAAQPFSLMPQAQAEDVFGARVWSEAYFNKLAEFGIVPTSQADVDELLKLAGNLRAAEQHPAVKAAQAKSPFAIANEAIEQFLGGDGQAQSVKRAEAAAAQLLQDPQIYQALLSLKVAEAQQFQAQAQPAAA